MVLPRVRRSRPSHVVPWTAAPDGGPSMSAREQAIDAIAEALGKFWAPRPAASSSA